ncbi:MAG: endolytic transglycosylase MltG [Ruminococcus sp.]|nr:endolytic transglycosylase MltG [Ruminococcus sp.]
MISKSENALGEISIDQPVQTEPKRTSSNSSGHKKSNSGKKKKKRKQKKHGSIRIYGVLIMLTLVFVISISLAIGIIEIGKDMLGINGSQKLVLFTIPEGATTAEIAENLYEDGIIKIPKAFIYFSRLSKADASYVAGNHEISASMAYETLIDELKKSPDVVEEQAVVDVMFPEGISLYDAAQKLEANNICNADRFLYYFNTGGFGYEFENYLPESTSRLKFYAREGYFFPDTYTFYEEMEPEAVCRKIYMNFDLKMTEEDYARIDELGTTLDEVIILASMVQAEAANDEEMPSIASVFWNRLKYPEDFGGGKLQSDPTSKYVTEIIRPNIELDNQQIYDAYDTYVCVGLPAGAIGNPGISAIHAVLYPNETDYFYFYANIDTGVTYFARNLEEHNANIEMVKQQQAEADALAQPEGE